MVSNGSTFKLYVPAKSLFITGRNDITSLSKNKIENWRPQHFLEALMVHPVEPDEKPILLNLTDEDNAAYILALVRTEPGRLAAHRALRLVRPHQPAHRSAAHLRRVRQHPHRRPL